MEEFSDPNDLDNLEPWNRTGGEMIDDEEDPHQLEISDDRIAMYQKILDTYGPIETVFYPSCARDVTPSEVFDQVLYQDVDHLAMKHLRQNWYLGITWDVKYSYTDVQYDLVVIQNPWVETERMTRYVKPWWLVLANNYHGDADYLSHDTRFEFLEEMSEWKNFKARTMKILESDQNIPFSKRDYGQVLFKRKK